MASLNTTITVSVKDFPLFDELTRLLDRFVEAARFTLSSQLGETPGTVEVVGKFGAALAAFDEFERKYKCPEIAPEGGDK